MRLVVVCEGSTEQIFCQTVLSEFLETNIETPAIAKSHGGIVSWAALKRQLEIILRTGAPIVSTRIDFYGIEERHHFPGWQAAHAISNKQERMVFLEKQMQEDIADAYRYRFIPYLQLHEFESLLFSSQDALLNFFPENRCKTELLERTFRDFATPEDINESPVTSPSHRLAAAIPEYKKTFHGPLLAEAIGIPRMLACCPHFSQWVAQLQGMVKTA